MKISRERIRVRGEELLQQESDQPVGWWYLSFAEDAPPQGRGFLGAVLIKASGMVTALTLAGLSGLNPGGGVSGFPLPYTDAEAAPWTERLLTREEAEALPRPAALP